FRSRSLLPSAPPTSTGSSTPAASADGQDAGAVVRFGPFWTVKDDP
ncbi:unnamed protein product, partial [Musa textilis]